uniref:Intraflagellar transport protein n=1 Tax=Mucochytrium quahogii TaxID=96639 RepID=A0A7S2RUI0_9STRA
MGGEGIPTMMTTGLDDEAFKSSENSTNLENKKIAYLLDQLTIRIMDLVSGYSDATINHNSKVDWLELNARGDLVLYRDKRRQLHLYNVHKQSRTTLLTYCNYVQWVPESDVVVAQNRGNLCVWYNIDAPEKVTIIPINGEVEDIERIDGKTEVRVDEGINTVVYCLDEALIGFGGAVEDGNLEKAMKVLDGQSKEKDVNEMRPETETMWKQLSKVALSHGRLDIAERCHAAIGDVAMTRYLRKVNKTKMQVSKATGTDGNDHWIVRAKLSLLKKEFRDAELIYLEQGQTDEAVEMYQILHQWDEAIRVAEERNHPEAEEMKTSYFDYLLSSGQEEKAAKIRENEGSYIEAIDMYLKGGRPAKAMHVVNTYKSNYKTDLLERIATALTSSGMHDKAGGFYERMGQVDRALDAYIKGHAYRNAVELARREFPAQVVRLEEAWGDWLVKSKNMESAIGHYIEANASKKAIEAALSARQWTKAGQLVDALQASDEDLACPYYKQIARHYHQAQQFNRAENFYVQAGCEKEAIQMYTDAGLWDAAHKLATRYMSSGEVSNLYHRQAQTLESKQKYREAERLLLTVNSVDKAIAMYKKARKFDHMIRLVAAYRKDILKDTHLHLAGQLEMEGDLREAEEHFAQAGDWPSAVNMYTANDMWDEAIRVAKYHGGLAASRKVAYQWAKILGGEAGAKLLTKLGLIEQAIDYAIETSSFQEALQLAKNSLPARVPEVHLKHALYLEDEERFTEAEGEFIKAGKPKEAIEMYNHQQDWPNAMRVAERYDPSSISDVLVAQAKLAVECKQFSNAEMLFLNAKKPEFALYMYQEQGLWQEAIKFAKKHLPHKLQEVTKASSSSSSAAAAPTISSPTSSKRSPTRKSSYQPSGGGGSSNMDAIRSAMDSARLYEDQQEFTKAVDCYLHIAPDEEDNGSVQAEEVDLMVVAWERAVRLASQHSKDDYSQVVEHVAQRLVEVNRYNAAGDLYEEVGQHKQAVECFIHAKKWDKARAVTELAPAYKEQVDRAYKKHMRNERNPQELLKMGDFDSALALHAEQGDWEKVFGVVDSGQAPAELGAKYAAEMAGRLLENTDVGTVSIEKVDDVIAKLAKYGAPPGSQHFAVFCRLSQEVLSRPEKDIVLQFEGSPDQDNGKNCYIGALRNLRECLFNTVKQRSNRESRKHEGKFGDSNLKTLERLLLVVHLTLMQYICAENGSDEMSTNILVTLLQFTGDGIPCDKAFYMSGMACKNVQWMGKAFVLLNRYLDLTEAIDEGEMGDIDNSDFKDTDIPLPHKHPLPKEHYLAEEDREEIREWIIGAAMDSGVEQEPIDMDWLREVRSQVAEQLGHIVRRFDRSAMPIDEYLVQIRQQYLEY